MAASGEKKKMGRPTIYTDALSQEICQTVATSRIGIVRLCKQFDHWPHHDTIYQWIYKHREFAEHYARAKEHQIEVLVDEMLEICDDSTNDFMLDKEGQLKVDHENINRSRFRVDTRKWLASKLKPKKYGVPAKEEGSGTDFMSENREQVNGQS